MNEISKKLLYVSGLFVVAFGIGRFTKPAQVKVETKEVVKTVTVKEDAKEKIVFKEKIVYKDGTVKETERTEDRNSSKEGSSVDSTKESNTETKRDIGLSLNALAIVDISDIKGHRDYGIFVKKRVVGNINVGAMATIDKKVGISVGMDF